MPAPCRDGSNTSSSHSDGGAPCFTPPSAVGGSADLVTVTGTNLRAAVNPTVKVGTTTVPPGLIQTSTLTELTFTVPLGAGNGKISVTTVDGTALSLGHPHGPAAAPGDRLLA